MSKGEFIYVVVYSTSHAIQIEKMVSEIGIECKLIPVPRQISSDCGVCVRIQQGDATAVERLIAEKEIQIQGFLQ
ncbi:MAG: DUF3343 domain-containing protein [Anaerolineales bacterium]|jgi:hypothetical protein